MPGSQIVIYLFSDPSVLTTMVADADGEFRGNFVVPKRISAGNHTMQVAMKLTGNAPANVSVGIAVTNTATKSTATKVTFSGKSDHLTRAARSTLRKFARSVSSDNNVRIACTAARPKQPSKGGAHALASARSERVCEFLARQGIEHLRSVRSNTRPAKRFTAGSVQVVASSTTS